MRGQSRIVYLQKVDEYIDLLNNGYIPKSCDFKTKFTNGDTINRFWGSNKNKIIDILNNDLKYKKGYETAKRTAIKFQNETQSQKEFRLRIEEYIDLVNSGYIPKHCDYKTTFQNGEFINQFWINNKDKIVSELNNNQKYEIGYEQAKEIIKQVEMKIPKKDIFSQKLKEYIELLNSGYEPKYCDLETKFTNGEFINHFWRVNKAKIIDTLNNDLKYAVGYEKAKEIVKQVEIETLRKVNFFKKIYEYIELLNTGYIPRYYEHKTTFQNGDLINQFWPVNKDKIINLLNNDPKYQVGYETAKEMIKKVETETLRKAKFLKKITEYIELLNLGYEPKYCDLETKFENGDGINYFWQTNKAKIIDLLNNDPKYIVGYDTAKDMIEKVISNSKKKEASEPNKLKISKRQILKYLGIELKKETDNSVEDIIKIACFNKCVSKQNRWIKEAYQSTLNKLDKLNTLDEAKIVDIISREIIENCLEKEEREEFKQTILLYLEKVKELQKLDVAFEEDNQNRIEKIKKYNFDEFDIEECVLISLEFNQAKIIEPTNNLYNRRKLISSYIIDWNEFTLEEKEEIIKQNNFTIEEIALINEKQEEIKVLKKLR